MERNVIKIFEDTSSSQNQIPGVIFKELRTFPDDRGFFREIIRFSDPIFDGASDPGERNFAQWSHSKMGRNTVKAWHFHHLQIDWWYVPLGMIHVVLFDGREESPTYKRKIEFLLGDEDGGLAAVVRIPQGVLHGCKVLTDFAHLLYITSQIYNPADEGRHPFNSEFVPHNWGNEAELIVAPNDRKLHIPPHARIGSE